MSEDTPDYIIRNLYPEQADTLLKRVDEVEGLSIRTLNCCINHGIVHPYQLLAYSPQDLLGLRNSFGGKKFGQKTVNELTAFMKDLGSPLKPDLVEPEA